MRPLPVRVSSACRLLAAAAASVLLVAGGCRVGYPFRGPGYDADRGVVHPDAGSQVLVVVTRGDIKAASREKFANHLRDVIESMNQQSGLVGYSVRRELFGSRVWTMSVWVDRGSMTRFVRSTAHHKAMASGSIAAGSFMTAAAPVDASRIPLDWAEAERMLEGRADQE
ncbi:MAG: antibiotic biosynthesis monooxygenase [Phycisphaeraceae bacterium]|nr:antibiotic biosynthesis monooxygenase [Phycisphaerae bacterium]MBX3393408.1 antibiotic biosynthesis monooxygenase [Phycisphaeraceae bacterium]